MTKKPKLEFTQGLVKNRLTAIKQVPTLLGGCIDIRITCN